MNMPEIREKVGWFQKLLGMIGKHYYWWTAKKMSAVMMTFDFLECLRILVELNDGDIYKALKDFHDIGIKAGESVASELLGPGEMIFSRNIKDLPFILKVSWYIFFGENLKDIKFFEDENGQMKMIWTLDRCIFCAALKKEKELKINKETMKDESYGSVVAGAMEGAMNAVLNYVKSPYYVIVKETRCIAKGDPFPEYTAFIYKREED